METREWREKTKFSKFIFIATFPINLPLMLTIPQADQWNKFTSVLVSLFSPSFLLWVINRIFLSIPLTSPFLFPSSFGFGIIIAFIILFTSQKDKVPKYFHIFTFWVFLVSIVWIYLFAQELVSFLNVIQKETNKFSFY